MFGAFKKIYQKWRFILFISAVFLGFFFRIYKFSEWLPFSQDAFRDALIVSHAYEKGIQYLPLLGPRAGGSNLRLGPAYYNLQYLFSKLIGSLSAPALTLPNLFFSLLAVPALFLLLRKFFSKAMSMALTGLFSFSFLAIEYSRFAWNPNSSPFFNIIFFWSLLEIYGDISRTKRYWLIFLASSVFSISTQLHFSNFLGLPIILLAFLAFNWKRSREIIGIREILLFFLPVFIFYLPVILNEHYENLNNSREFLKTIGGKSSSSNLINNFFQDIRLFGKYFFRIFSGIVNPSGFHSYLGAVFMLLSALINWLEFKREKDPSKKRFLFLSGSTFLVFLALYLPLVKKIDNPRFFLPLFMLVYIYLGYLGISISKYIKNALLKKLALAVFILLILFSTFSNVRWTLAWFSELDLSQRQTIDTQKNLVIRAKKKKVWWTWGIFMRTAEYMKSECPDGNIYFFLSSKMDDYSHSFEYALKYIGAKTSLIINTVYYDQEGCYFFIFRPNQSPTNPKLKGMLLGTPANLGNVSVVRFYIPEEKKILNTKTFAQKKSRGSIVLEKRDCRDEEIAFWNFLAQD